jgi:hypothetical protein
MLLSWLYSGWAVSSILVVSRRFVPKPVMPFCEANLLVPFWRGNWHWAQGELAPTRLKGNFALVNAPLVVIFRMFCVLHFGGLTTARTKPGHALLRVEFVCTGLEADNPIAGTDLLLGQGLKKVGQNGGNWMHGWMFGMGEYFL